jgi:hypothetical protein
MILDARQMQANEVYIDVSNKNIPFKIHVERAGFALFRPLQRSDFCGSVKMEHHHEKIRGDIF